MQSFSFFRLRFPTLLITSTLAHHPSSCALDSRQYRSSLLPRIPPKIQRRRNSEGLSCCAGRLFLDPVNEYRYKGYQYALTVGYDGGEFNGWQAQRHKNQARVPTVQQTIESALSRVLKVPVDSIRLIGASRTDTGVHARGQIASFMSERPLDTNRLVLAVNSRLPRTVRVFSARWVNPDFHPLVHVRRKRYSYKVHTGVILDPLCRFDRWHVPLALDISLVRQAARAMEGKHDFEHFSGAKTEALGRGRDSHRSIDIFNVEEIQDGLRFDIVGAGFLYHQVRHVVGACIGLACGLYDLQYLTTLLSGSAAGQHHNPKWQMGRAHGLCLEEIELVDLPPPTKLIHPEYEHDEYGRVSSINTSNMVERPGGD
ncbi:hypothetical protein AAMO2058_000658400 [Amorphochlora amoebiformis]|uniref:tRNA pseudouridine synthase n=1 Tax=Amorphochlora amoebiformis TaxID=1561963 RepID=A0A7S0CPZ3_9EUKA|mmetsp:Transcript_11562/g.18294  ORF Transcript_11562/g.18294 Transcript_11562/m.18294 type:complete len:371 (+) Transcript_11562:140-1252(+)